MTTRKVVIIRLTSATASRVSFPSIASWLRWGMVYPRPSGSQKCFRTTWRKDTSYLLKAAMSQLSRRGGPSEELSILKLLKAKDHPHSGHATVLHLLDHFQISGPNGEHHVSVTDLIAPMNMILENSQLRNRVSNDYIPKKWTQTWRTGLDS